jgi:hypothetical protein
MTFYIQENFCLDGRISVQSVMATSKDGKFLYSPIIRALIQLGPPVATRHKMSALVGEKEICRNNLAGQCTLGNLYLQRVKPPNSPTRNKGGKFKKSDEKYPPRSKASFPVTVTREHRAAVGPPRDSQILHTHR